jgi:hypothetical protein
MLKVLLIPDLAIAVWRLIKLNQAVMSESKYLYSVTRLQGMILSNPDPHISYQL